MHQMFNVVADLEGRGSAVLIRACEPVEGIEHIVQRRGGKTGPVTLTGPGKVASALALNTSHCNHPLFEPGGVEILDAPAPNRFLIGPRVGIDYAESGHRAAPWRLAVADSAWVTERRTLVLWNESAARYLARERDTASRQAEPPTSKPSKRPEQLGKRTSKPTATKPTATSASRSTTKVKGTKRAS
jgi:hypothetical protein